MDREIIVATFIKRAGRVHVMVFTPRGGTVRLISLRKANRREVRRYEQG